MAIPNTWTRERVNLAKRHTDRAAEMVARGAFEGRGHEFADTKTPGLVLRVGRQGGAWYLKTESKTVRLADMSLPVKAAREVAERTKADLKSGLGVQRANLLTWEAAHKRGFTLANARDAAFPEMEYDPSDEHRREYGPWEYRDLVDLYLAEKLPTLTPAWAKQFERHLRRTVDGALERKPVSNIEAKDLLVARDKVRKAHTLSAAADSVEAMKAALDWALGEYAHLAGLESLEYPWWRVKVKVKYKPDAREHTPRLDELVRTLIVAERHRALGGTAKTTSDAVLGALWATVLTGQRVGALTGTRRAAVIPWEDGPPGWAVWTWTGEEMKKAGGLKRPHAIPMPPEALAAIARFDADPASPFLFPSTVPGKPLVGNALTQLFARLQGKEKAGKASGKTEQAGRTVRPEGDLFERYGIRPWVRHDVRRSMPTYLDMHRLVGSGSAILAHRKAKGSSDGSQEAELAQAMTLKHYLHGQRLELKRPGMETWVKAVLEAYEAEKLKLGA
ncbi:MAG: hypothetical protein WAP03_22595 [Methylorubrum rhodinum]|uniref:hypothetical protein n=1 Tax=Methylorubrum rhodinum TaxID=29428 RepID=UPI003BB1BC8D